MGFGSIWHWVIVLLIVLALFGTKKLRNMGEDIGSAIKGFKKGLQDGEHPPEQLKADPPTMADAKPTSSASNAERGRTE